MFQFPINPEPSIYVAEDVNGNGVWKWKWNVNGVCRKFESKYVKDMIGIYPSKHIWCIAKRFKMVKRKVMHIKIRKVEMQRRSCYWDHSILQSTPNWNVTIINSGWLKCCTFLFDYVHFIVLELKQRQLKKLPVLDSRKLQQTRRQWIRSPVRDSANLQP